MPELLLFFVAVVGPFGNGVVAVQAVECDEAVQIAQLTMPHGTTAIQQCLGTTRPELDALGAYATELPDLTPEDPPAD
jgi:hypothetical protein